MLIAVAFIGPILRWYRDRVQLIRASASTGVDDDDDRFGETTSGAISTIRIAADAVLSLIGSVFDYTRAIYQIATEWLRNAYGFWFLGSNNSNNTYVFDDDDDDNDIGGVGIANRYCRNNNKRHRQQRTANNATAKNSRNRCNSLPELEDCVVVEPSFGSDHYCDGFELLDENNNSCSETNNEMARIAQQQTTPLSRQQQRGGGWDWSPLVRAELEPAFLRESDYPPGWMVYHPVLRVVTKTEAEQYDRKQETEQHERSEQQQVNDDAASPDDAAVVSTNPPEDGGDHCEEEKKDDRGGESSKDGVDSAAEIPISGDDNDTAKLSTPNRQRQQENNHNAAAASPESMPVRRSVVAT